MTYNGRSGPNVSQYLQNLNSIDPQPLDLPATDDYSNFADDLALFTNLEFVDFDQGIGADSNNGDESQYDPTEEERARRLNASAGYRNTAKDAPLNRKAEGFMDEQFQFPDFSTSIYPNVSETAPAAYPTTTTAQNTPFPIQPALSPASSASAKSAAKRPSAAQHTTSPAISVEDAARFAAEEDKRRRNTAASARFRIKKKQREQEVERTAKEMTERVGILESRVKHLEMENEWLRSLIVDKSGNVPARKAGKKEGTDADADGISAESEEEREAKREAKRRRTDGVGTAA